MNQLSEFTHATNNDVSANYNKLSDHIRRLTPQGIQCSVFCGGTNCKYESPQNWKSDSLAVQGIYSHWITDDILAMARPSTLIIVQKNVIQQFQSLGIRSIINLQSPREHASCGQSLESSGFSYDPNVFMENNIFFYNFAWKDYADATLIGLLNMVKVLAFAISEGRVAIHCHAGLGRTGVLISCFLVYSLRVSANDAIKYVRIKRPGSVQTRRQILCVRNFAQFILPQTITYFLRDSIIKNKYMKEFTLKRFLRRQKIILHGYEERNFRYVPKIVHCLCERILKLCGCWVNDVLPSNIPLTIDFICMKLHERCMQRHESTYSLSSSNSDNNIKSIKSSSEDLSSPDLSGDLDNGDLLSDIGTLDGDEIDEEELNVLTENKCFQDLQTLKSFYEEMSSEESIIIQDINVAVDALIYSDYSTLDLERRKKIRKYQNEINSSGFGWTKILVETDLNILSILLINWIEGLKEPVIKRDDFENIVVFYRKVEVCFQKFAIENACLIEYLLRFLGKIQPVSNENRMNLLKRIIAALSKQSLIIDGNLVPADKGFPKFREGTLVCTKYFFETLLDLIETTINKTADE